MGRGALEVRKAQTELDDFPNPTSHHRVSVASRMSEQKSNLFLSAFTIMEVLVASTVLILLLVVVLSTISQTADVTQRASNKISSFQGARAAFDLLTEMLGQATLNSYWDYDSPTSPTKYLRKSELHFLIGNAGAGPLPGTVGTGQALFFQAPAGVSTTHDGLENLLNAAGYFISYGDEAALPSPFPAASPKYRYRLMQAIQAAEDLRVYNDTTGNAWVSGIAASGVPNMTVRVRSVVPLAYCPPESTR